MGFELSKPLAGNLNNSEHFLNHSEGIWTFPSNGSWALILAQPPDQTSIEASDALQLLLQDCWSSSSLLTLSPNLGKRGLGFTGLTCIYRSICIMYLLYILHIYGTQYRYLSESRTCVPDKSVPPDSLWACSWACGPMYRWRHVYIEMYNLYMCILSESLRDWFFVL